MEKNKASPHLLSLMRVFCIVFYTERWWSDDDRSKKKVKAHACIPKTNNCWLCVLLLGKFPNTDCCSFPQCMTDATWRLRHACSYPDQMAWPVPGLASSTIVSPLLLLFCWCYSLHFISGCCYKYWSIWSTLLLSVVWLNRLSNREICTYYFCLTKKNSLGLQNKNLEILSSSFYFVNT